MAIARSKLVDVSVARWYHCVSRCVRKAFLLGEGDGNRKQWLEKRIEELGQIFAVEGVRSGKRFPRAPRPLILQAETATDLTPLRI